VYTCCGVSYCNDHNTCINIIELLLAYGDFCFFVFFSFVPKSVIVVTEGCVSNGNEGLVKEFRKLHVLRHGYPNFFMTKGHARFCWLFRGPHIEE
jgi:hypothetical protein